MSWTLSFSHSGVPRQVSWSSVPELSACGATGAACQLWWAEPRCSWQLAHGQQPNEGKRARARLHFKWEVAQTWSTPPLVTGPRPWALQRAICYIG